MPKGDYLYSEAKLAEHIGIPRKNLAAIRERHLDKDVHWKNHAGQIAFSLQGVSHLLITLDLAASALKDNWHEECLLEPPAKKNGAILLLMDRNQRPTEIVMQVTRLFPNPYLVEAQEVARPLQRYRVRVKSNLHLIQGMQFKAIPDPGNPGFWMMIGNTPRWRGRW